MAETYIVNREIGYRYLDPLDLIWLATARRLGLRVERSPDVYAATDGQGLLQLSTDEGMDPDDSVAQMIFHEICHWICNGEETYHQRDWGFPLDFPDQDYREDACNRFQRWLARRYGLEAFFSVTTPYREYFDKVGDALFEPLDDSESEQKAVAMARAAAQRWDKAPWGPALVPALEATRAMFQLVQPFMEDYASDVAGDALNSLWGASLGEE